MLLKTLPKLGLAVFVAAPLLAFGRGGGAVASYTLPVRSSEQIGACADTSDGMSAVVGIPWGGTSPQGAPHDYSCRGFRLISLRTHAARTVALLPARDHRGLWAVDQPVLVGHWLAYVQYVDTGLGDWRIVVVDLRSGRDRVLAHWDGQGAFDVGPLISAWGQTLMWTAGTHISARAVVYRIHTCDLATGGSRIIASSLPSTAKGAGRFIDARFWGDTAVFLRTTDRGSDTWVADMRSGRIRHLTQTGKAAEPVITGPWVAWGVLGRDSVGPVIVEDLRTGTRRIVSSAPAIDLSAGDGRLAWDSFYSDKFTILDLVTGRRFGPPNLSREQGVGTYAHVVDNVIVEAVTNRAETTTQSSELERIVVYLPRNVTGTSAG